MDEESFEAVYSATARPLLAYLIGVTGMRDLAEDILQETYYRYLSRSRPPMPAEETRKYLFRVAINLLRDRWRRKEDTWTGTQDEVFPAGGLHDTLSGALHGIDLQLDVREAMSRLSPRDRELLWLAYVEGMRHAEIAEVTGLRAISVRILLHRARGRAARLLRPQKEDG